MDLDNVIALTDPLIRRLIGDMFGVHLKQTDIVQFDYWRCGITREQDDMVFDRFHKEDCASVDPLNGAIDVLQSLRDRFEIHIVTGRPLETRKLTLSWLRNHYIPYDKLDFVKSKHKSQVDFKAFIEDHRETAYGMAARKVHSFLFDYPWNQPLFSDPPNLMRVDSWEEIRNHLEEIVN